MRSPPLGAAILVLCAAAAALLPAPARAVGCTKLGACRWRCTTEAKSGDIDLTKIGQEGPSPFPKWDAQPGKDGHVYSYNPCYPYDIRASGAEECQNVIVCRQRLVQVPYEFYNAGTQNTEKFVVLNGHDVVVEYRGSQGRQTNVHIVCGGAEPELEVTGEEAGQRNIYWLKMSTIEGCLVPLALTGGLSTGSILCIILATLVVVYAAGGALLLRYHYQAPCGGELIPHREQWGALPALVRDGCVYTAARIGDIRDRYRGGGGEKGSYHPL